MPRPIMLTEGKIYKHYQNDRPYVLVDILENDKYEIKKGQWFSLGKLQVLALTNVSVGEEVVLYQNEQNYYLREYHNFNEILEDGSYRFEELYPVG